MAYPKEHSVDQYKRYVIRYSMGEEGDKKLSKPEWEAKQKKKVKTTVLDPKDSAIGS